jgi:hypothetical protein
MGKQLATEMAPPFNLVAHFMIAGSIFYMITSLILPFFSSELESGVVSTTLASLSHLYLLGFVMMFIFGAMYQLVPVILEIPLFSKDFAYVQFYLYTVGLSLMSYAFLKTEHFYLLPYGALMVYISMFIFTVNIFLTYRNLERWSIPAKYIFASNIFLFIAVTIGFVVALNLFYGFLDGDGYNLIGAHISGVLIGYVMMTVIGVAMVLIPMFSLSHGFEDRYADIAFNFITLGVALYMTGEIFELTFLIGLGAFLFVVALLLGAYQMWVIFKGRVRKQNDYWAKGVMASFGFFLSALLSYAISFVFGSERFAMFGGYIFFFGFLAFLIIAHIYKILPFLVWYQRYSPLVGKEKVPMLHEMVVERVADKQFVATFAGTVISSLGVLFKVESLFIIGTLVMALSGFLVIYNIYYTLTYGRR